MPDLTGLTEAEAREALDDLQLDLVISVRERPSPTVTEGTILVQYPSAGQPTDESVVVRLTVAGPPPTPESVAEEVEVSLIENLADKLLFAPSTDRDIVTLKGAGKLLLFGFKGRGASSPRVWDALKEAVLENHGSLEEVGLLHVGFVPVLSNPIVFYASIDNWRHARTEKAAETWAEIGLVRNRDLF